MNSESRAAVALRKWHTHPTASAIVVTSTGEAFALETGEAFNKLTKEQRKGCTMYTSGDRTAGWYESMQTLQPGWWKK